MKGDVWTEYIRKECECKTRCQGGVREGGVLTAVLPTEGKIPHFGGFGPSLE